MNNSGIIPLYPKKDNEESIKSIRVWHYVVNHCECNVTDQHAEAIDDLFAEYYNNVNDFGQACNRKAVLEYVRLGLKRKSIFIPDKTLDEIMHHFSDAIKKFGGAIEDV